MFPEKDPGNQMINIWGVDSESQRIAADGFHRIDDSLLSLWLMTDFWTKIFNFCRVWGR